MTKKFLDGVYGDEGLFDSRELYRDWAASYDEEILENGYVTPERCAEALAAHAADPGAPVMDIGCGTGLSGLALQAAGFSVIDGIDVSPEMLDQARARNGVYRNLSVVDPEKPLPFDPGDYANVVAAGVISPDHAPPETMDAVLDRLPAGGCLVFSLNDHAIENKAFPAQVEKIVATGVASLAFQEHGPHLPGHGLGSTIFVLKKR